MGRTRRVAVVAVCAITGLSAGCFTGRDAALEVNKSWRGKTRAQIEARWGPPAQVQQRPGDTMLKWTYTRRRYTLPSGGAGFRVDADGLDAHAEIRPGRMWVRTTDVVAVVGADGRIVSVEGPSLRWGPPADANVRWGVIFGAHAGFGRLDDTPTPLPSGGLYIGGMLGPRTGLVGAFSLVSGTGDPGGAMGFVWALGVQWWSTAAFSVRGGPALLLGLEPGFEDPFFDQGVNGAVSYALIRKKNFVLDLRLDVTAARKVTLGSLGLGVNLN